MEIVLATNNLHKIREFKELFKAHLPHLELISLRQYPDYRSPEETGQTFRENALLKAVDAAKHLKKWVLADDSGLVIPALNGDPGVYSARYAGAQATDKENCEKVLRKLEPFSLPEERTAHYECFLAVVNPEGELIKSAEGICEGHLLLEPRGRNGFGYDPLFVKNDYEKTFAELDESVKNRISHRRKAFERLLAFLYNLRE